MAKLFFFDKRKMQGTPGIVGLDEAGRGCFAGPVVAGAVWVRPHFYENATALKKSSFINDSKQIPAKLREEVFALIKFWEEEQDLVYAVGIASVDEIESYNILGASRLAMERAVLGIIEKIGGDKTIFETAGSDDTPLFDKGRKFPKMLVDGNPLVPFVWKHNSIVKGDAKSLAIAMASIVAKVSRDKIMCELDKDYPHYKFSENKGYGTAAHIEALKKYGITSLHRLKFLRNLIENSNDVIPGAERFFVKEDIIEQEEFNFENNK